MQNEKNPCQTFSQPVALAHVFIISLLVTETNRAKKKNKKTPA
jgi:hypothetical protein